MGMRMGMVGMDLASGAQGSLLPQVETPVIAVDLDADPTGEYVEQITIEPEGTHDITCATEGATIYVRTSTDDGANWTEWSVWEAEV